MRKILGATIALIGVALAVYIGLYLMLWGGIVQIVDAVQEEPVEGAEIAWGVIRIVFAGTATAFTLYGIGFVAFLVGGWGNDRPRSPYRSGVFR